jgi:uncharacterized protein DUF3105
MRQGAKVHNTMSRARGALLLGGILVAMLVGFIAWIYLRQAASGLPAEVEYIEVGPTEHVGGNIDYDQDLGTPPAGGSHNPVWQNCGFYEEPVRDENAVHSLEHGAVWITYQPNLPQDELERLSDLTQSNSFVLVSPYPDQDAPVVATAWGIQQRLGRAEDPELERFIKVYGQNSGSSGGGAHSSCTGGVGQPQ